MKLSFLLLTFISSLLLSCGEGRLEEYKTKGLEAFNQKHYRQARVFFGKALHEKPSDRDAAYYMGLSFKNDFDYDSAMFYFKRADILNTNDREVAEQMYEVALALQEWQIATTAMNVMINTGDNPEQYYVKRADLWRRRDHPGNAYYYTKLAMEYDSEDPKLYLDAATYAELVDSLPVSLAYIDSAIAKFGPNPTFIANRALYLNKMGEHKTAERIYRALLETDSTRVDIRYNLAKALEFQDSRKAKSEALDLYKSLRRPLGYKMPIDSIITRLEQELNP